MILKAFGVKWLLLCIVVCLPGVFSRIKNMPLTPQLETCYKRFSNVSLNRVPGTFITWHCESSISLSKIPFRLPKSEHHYLNGLNRRIMEKSKNNRGKRQATRCVRKEYRMLTTQERNDFHRAVNGMKQNTIVRPNVYDALAMLHSEMQILKAHGGPCFLGWHRVFMLMFEMALGDEVPGVCLPYWDSSLDNELENPAQSYMFSSELMGNGDGAITSGPFAGWRRPSDPNNPNSRPSPVLRNVGADGQLYSRESIEMILSRSDTSEIIAPNSDPDYDIEVHHGGIHIYIGGDMEALVTSPFDPFFFLHHGFVDYLWELFRIKLRNQLNIDPQTNYPMNHNIEFHSRDELMDIANFTCGAGYSDLLMETVEYEASPSCTQQRPTCDSPYLRCQLNTGRCIPITLQETPLPMNPGSGPVTNPPPVGPGLPPPVGPGLPPPVGPGLPPPTGPGLPPPVDQCAHIEQERHNVKPCQNSYCVNGICDINQWVYVPVKVVTIRPPEYNRYNSFPIINGDVSMTNDIYNPSGYSRTKKIIQGRLGKTPKGYTHCFEDGIGQIFVQSQGLNYEGFYKESSVIDQRLATTMSIAYVAVKNPGRGVTRALFRASDSCGRVCHTSCKNPRTGKFEPCSGLIELDSRYPRMFSKNYGDATLDIWDYGNGNGMGNECPMFNDDKFFLTFYCDYQDHLPWVDKMSAPPMMPRMGPKPQPPPSFHTQQCRVSPTCVLNTPCFSASLQCRFYGETHQCAGACGHYAVCNYGHYKEKICIGGTVFSETMNRCTSTPCGGQVGDGLPSWHVFANAGANYMKSLGSRMLSGSAGASAGASIFGGKR
ncbi:uncharacterized protein LOC121388499 [Gigantopelta aegis]|uniref:uncharacterized protein LOC121388499 n=1 Tax=Gigantopelta aegis TaxID=1735272 RepID=UPI001B88E485|nr:uncharacterized protein LOC121388499 [Gigantopelta aegis]